VRKEEQMMLDAFGEPYAEYAARTKRTIQWVARHQAASFGSLFWESNVPVSAHWML
jgi:hypothetical protein